METPIAVYSAPGKALLAGGYLVLFQEYSAFSVALSSRIHAAVYAPSGDSSELTIKSPQFDSEWRFPSKSGTHKNPFLEACYEVVHKYFGFDVRGTVVIWSDAGFHSQSEAKPNHFSDGLNRFSYHGRPITDVPKTGLGSSAALVVAVVAGIARLAAVNRPDVHELTKAQLHNLCQIAHCSAQQKVGSGFDVATAVYGSVVYSRFAPDHIPSSLDRDSIVHAVNQDWPMKLHPCQLPSNILVVMGDVAQGSETPGMVRNVLKWKNENREQSQKLFTELNEANMALANALNSEVGNDQQLASAISNVRKYLQELTRLSGVPIEPPKQTKLLNDATAIKGVLGGVVPGAGGDDAICLLVDTSVASLETVMAELNKIAGVSWMNLRLESSGLRTEPIHQY